LILIKIAKGMRAMKQICHKAPRIGLTLLVTLFLSVVQAQQQESTSPEQQSYDLCARGINDDPISPFIQTLHVTLKLTGPVWRLDNIQLNLLAEMLIRDTIWKGLASKVYVERFDKKACAASGNNEIGMTANVSEEDIKAIRDVERGNFEGSIERVTQIAKRTLLRLDWASTSPEPEKRWLRVFYATNREATNKDSPQNAFSMKRVDNLSYGSVEVSVRHEPKMNKTESPAIFKFEKATDLTNFAIAEKILPLTKTQWLQELKFRAKEFGEPGVLLFIHGYNVSFVEAARRTGQLTYDLAFPGPTIFFSWPSDAAVSRYPRDGRDAENSWVAAESVLSDVTGLLPEGRGPVYVIAHSMGNRVMIGGLALLLEKSPRKRKAIREIVMAAPDIDQETFSLNWMGKLLHTGPRFTLYASEHDLALGSSELIFGGKRLGIGGPSLFVTASMDSIDASEVTKEFFALNHSYYGDKTAVLSDIFYLIRKQLQPKERPHLKSLGAAERGPWAIR
jgi:esterase/lipase superfamily enzyme